jgi:hypothetical protein
MSDSLKGGLFVGAAVAVGLIAAFVLPSMVAGGEASKGRQAKAPPPPVMPNVVGRPLDEAERELRTRQITFVTDEDDVLGVVVPSVWEVCETQPNAGSRVRRGARLRAALPGTCDLG